MEPRTHHHGGALIGWFSTSFPFATLSATESELTLNVLFQPTFSFVPKQVIGLKIRGFLPLVDRGIKILHNVEGYPKDLVFWHPVPSWVIRRVHEVGFKPAGSLEA